jgi:predicted component of type VI protein secretion system
MNRMILLAAALTTMIGCASNKAADQPGTRIRDSSTTAQDTVNPSDSATHILDSVPGGANR